MSIGSEAGGLERLGAFLYNYFIPPSAALSLSSLGCALLIGGGYLVWRRWSRGRSARPQLILRALFPRAMLTSPSMRADLLYVLFNTFVMGLMFGWAIISGGWISARVIDGLTFVFGPVQAGPGPGFTAQILITLWLFLAYEIGYWIDHYSSHRFPLFWELHKVHHSAEVLTPLTVFRVHPFESVKFANILALTIGPANGIVSYLYGAGPHAFTITGGNLILVVFMHLFIHLQHSQIWIPLRGIAGRIILSPAHHQVHHSSNPAHFDRNFGSCLAVWDWMFGTLYVPSKEPERLAFGVEANGHNDHSVTGVFLDPAARFVAQASKLLGLRPEEPAAGVAETKPSTG